MITHPRVTLLSEPAFDVWLNHQEIEPGVYMMFIHLDVYCFTPDVLKRLQHEWRKMRPTLPPMVFCHGHIDDDKFHRFVTRFGWEHIHYTPCSDGVTRRIYVHYHYGVPDGRWT